MNLLKAAMVVSGVVAVGSAVLGTSGQASTKQGGSSTASAQKLVSAVSGQTFDREVLRSPVPVLVDFYASWCGPCRTLAPRLEAAAQELQGKVRIVKVNVDEQPELAEKYEVSALPTIILFRGGQPVDGLRGLVPQGQLIDWLKARSG